MKGDKIYKKLFASFRENKHLQRDIYLLDT